MVMKEKFLVCNNSLVILDYRYYDAHEKEIDDWCFETLDYIPRKGMVLTFKNKDDIVTFLLRWS